MGLDNFACPSTGGTGSNLRELAEKATLGTPHPAAAPASTACIDGCAWFVASPGTTLTVLMAGYFDLAFSAEDRLLEGEHDSLLNIITPLGFPGTPSGCFPKERVEDIAKATKYIETLKGPIKSSVRRNTAAAVEVVLRPFGGI